MEVNNSMELHQLLRHIRSGTAVCIFDIAGVCICQVPSKEDISIFLYEYVILEISAGTSYVDHNRVSCIYITIEK